ncbi:hypothetical protein M0R19_07615 [Candidatus Pacearchaeota archaeon]|nr:hypothetical protein [Candidatus Pacearchaeota archaeon]
MFRGIQIKVPEIEVLCPQSKKKFRIRSLSLGEEANMKSSLLASNGPISTKLNEIIYNAIVDEEKPTFEEFLKTTSTRDRDALLLGLYQITYGDEYVLENYQCVNPRCQKTYNLKTKLSNGFNISAYNGKEDLLTKEVPVELAENVIAYVQQPTLEYEKKVYEKLAENDLLTPLYLKISKLDITNADGNFVLSLDKDELDYSMVISKQLYSNHKTKINEAYYENFGKYDVGVTIVNMCPFCRQKDEFELDFVKQFFLVVFGT